MNGSGNRQNRVERLSHYITIQTHKKTACHNRTTFQLNSSSSLIHVSSIIDTHDHVFSFYSPEMTHSMSSRSAKANRRPKWYIKNLIFVSLMSSRKFWFPAKHLYLLSRYFPHFCSYRTTNCYFCTSTLEPNNSEKNCFSV